MWISRLNMLSCFPERRTYDLKLRTSQKMREDTLNPKSKSKSGKRQMRKYNLEEQHIYICPNCGHEFLYKVPEQIIKHMDGLPIQTLKRECHKCNHYVTATRKS